MAASDFGLARQMFQRAVDRMPEEARYWEALGEAQLWGKPRRPRSRSGARPIWGASTHTAEPAGRGVTRVGVT